MNKKYLKQLVFEAEQIEPENEILWQENYNKRLVELSKNLDATIEYLDTCSEKELNWLSEVFDELCEHFKSQLLIDCVERNLTRFNNEELQKQLKTELEYMKIHLQNKIES